MEYHPKQIEMTGAMDMIDDKGNRIKDGFVSGIQIQAAVMGSEAGCQFVKDVLMTMRSVSLSILKAQMVRESSHHLSMLE